MPEHDISFFAALIQEFGVATVALSMLMFAIALSIPTLLTWLKDGMKRREDKKLLQAISDLSSEIKILARQYNESISLTMVETIVENILKHHSWSLFDFVHDVIEKNDIQNERSSIEDSLKMQVFITFKAIDNDLMKFKYKVKPLSDFLDRCTWEMQVNETIIKTIYDPKPSSAKKILNAKMYLRTEFGNIHFLMMQNINRY